MRRSRGRGRRALARGDLLEAATHLLHGWKHGWPDAPPPDLVDLFDHVLARACKRPDGSWKPVADNDLGLAAAATTQARALRSRFAAYPLEDRVRLRTPKPGAPPARQGDLLVLKPHDPATGEPGLLYVTYNHGIGWLSSLFELSGLAGRYVIALEPSTWGYMDPVLLPFLGCDLDVLVQAQNATDFGFVEGLGSNLVPLRLGAGDWVDPSLFHPRPVAERRHDIVAIGAWDHLKRHDVIFRAVARLRSQGRRASLALVGYDMGWTRAHVERQARRHGLVQDVTWLDRVPYADVARIVADSRVGVLMSRREGANRGIYECWMADTPTVVYRHHRGVNLDQVTPANGLLADDDELAPALATVLDHPARFGARAWALAHTGCHVATRRLNEAAAERAARRGLPWTRDALVHAYAGYMSPAERESVVIEHERLAAWWRPA